MPRWVVGLLIIALFAGILGFGVMAAGGTSTVRICFLFFLVGFVAAVAWRLRKRLQVPPPP